MASPASSNSCNCCCPWFRPSEKKETQKSAYEPSKSVFIAPKEETEGKTKHTAHVRFVSTAQISFNTALREGPRLPPRESGQSQ